MGNNLSLQQITPIYLFPICLECKTLSLISVFIQDNEVKVLIECQHHKTPPNIYDLSFYLNELNNNILTNNVCSIDKNHVGVKVYFCNNCNIWICEQCIEQKKEEHKLHCISIVPFQKDIKSIEPPQEIKSAILRKIESFKKFKDAVTYLFEDFEHDEPKLKERFNKFYNINSSLIEISKIIISNYFSSLKWANNIILTNYKRNINFTPMTELFAILKIYKERKSSSLPSALRTLLLNPLNNYIIKPKMIIPYYKVEYNKRVNHFCYLGNDEIVFNSNNSIYITNIYTNSIIKEFSFHNGIINCLIKLRKDSIATCSENGLIYIFNKEKLLHTLTGHQSCVYQIIELQNGDLASCSEDKTIKIWETNTYKCKATLIGHSVNVISILQLKDGRLISGSSERKIKLWNLQTYQEITTLAIADISVTSMKNIDNNRIFAGFAFYSPMLININDFTFSEPFQNESITYEFFECLDSSTVMGSKDGIISFIENRNFECVEKITIYGTIVNINKIEKGKVIVLNANGTATIYLLSDVFIE